MSLQPLEVGDILRSADTTEKERNGLSRISLNSRDSRFLQNRLWVFSSASLYAFTIHGGHKAVAFGSARIKFVSG